MIIGFIGALAVISAVWIILYKNSGSRQIKKQNAAAARLMKEEYLSSALAGRQDKFAQTQKKLLIRLTWNENGKQEYVVDPAGGIWFGRDQTKNNVILEYEKVSSVHCRIILSQNRLFIQDLRSLNGTFLIRGGKTYRVQNVIELYDGDIIQIGYIQFKIHPFYFDLRGI